MSKSILKNSLNPVAFLISMYFPPEPGGGAITAWNRASILTKIGYAVFVLCAFPSYPSGNVTEPVYRGKFFYIEKMENVTLIRLRLLPLESRGQLRRFILFLNFIFLSLIWMPKILRITFNIEIVYALAPNMFSCLIGFIYSKFTRSFFIYEVSAFWPEELAAYKVNLYSALFFFGKIVAKISYTLPHMIIVISNSAQEYVTNSYHPKARVYPMHIGVDPSRYPTITREQSRKELIEREILPRILEKKFIVLYTGVITKVTNVEILFYAADKLKNSQQDIAFLVIGEGEEKERLEEFRNVKELKNLLLLPFQPSIMVPYIISAADVCVVPLSTGQIYETTVPTKFFDYLACHKPLIGICGGELAEIINSNHIGITVTDGEIDKVVDAILNLKNSPSLIQFMEKNTHSVLEFFSLYTLASRLNEVLNKEITRWKASQVKN
jgi:glycosyltransferase involved in cell wall biosynthesis